MMDFLLTSLLLFAIGILVGRLFWKLNPFLMLLGIFIGAPMLAASLNMNPVYAVVLVVGCFYGLHIMRVRNLDAQELSSYRGSLFGRAFEWFQFWSLKKQAEEFKQSQSREQQAYDEFNQYKEQVDQEKQRAYQQAQEQAQRAQQESEQARRQQEKAKRQRAEFEEEKRRYEQQQKQADQESESLDTRTPYEILQIKVGASADEIKRAYKKLSQKYHPEKNLQMSEQFRNECAKEFIKIKNAYDALK